MSAMDDRLVNSSIFLVPSDIVVDEVWSYEVIIIGFLMSTSSSRS